VELNRLDEAIKAYEAAIKIDGLFYPAKVNLAMLHNRNGDKEKAEVLLRQVVATHPDLHDISYSLGLLLAEKKGYEEALQYMRRAADGMPQRARVHYNLALLLQYLKRDAEAHQSLLRARELEPSNMDFLYALADYYLKRGKLSEARGVAEEMIAKHPSNRIGYDIVDFIEKESKTRK
jgi:tetratricopeptide (TPR) repeat protein